MFEISLSIFVFLIGLCVGSFLNVCICRMPKEGYSLIKPNSHCPHCGRPIRWHDNIPLLSYILLKRHCRDCGQKIPFRYFLVELLTGLIFLAIYKKFGVGPHFFVYSLLAAGLLVSTFIDFDYRIIPDEISIGGIAAGLALSFAFPALHQAKSHLLSLGASFLGVLIGGGVIWLIGCLGDFIFKKESMGGGDVKLLAMIGAFLGYKAALLSLPLASLAGAIVGIIIKLRTKESVIAFGPYLSLGAMVCIFWADEILSLLFYY